MSTVSIRSEVIQVKKKLCFFPLKNNVFHQRLILFDLNCLCDLKWIWSRQLHIITRHGALSCVIGHQMPLVKLIQSFSKYSFWQELIFRLRILGCLYQWECGGNSKEARVLFIVEHQNYDVTLMVLRLTKGNVRVYDLSRSGER